jgi:hypothetical protein
MRGLPSTNPVEWFNRDRVNIPNMLEVIWQPLYDTLTYPATGINSLIFFQEQIGKGTPPKTLTETNMELDSQLPKGQAFKVTGIQIEFYTLANSASATIPGGYTAAWDQDVYVLSKSGSLKFRIGSKNYLEQAPLGKFPPVQSIKSEAMIYGQNAARSAITYAAFAGREFAVVPKLLESTQNFNIELNDLPALPSGANAKIVVRLNGYLGRNAQ